MRNSDITLKGLDQFQQNEKSPIFGALGEISDYMNARIADLAVRMTRSTTEEVKALCRDILERAQTKYRLKSPREAELLLAAINGGLTECQDWLASHLLTQAGHALLGEPTEISGWPE